MNRNNLLKALEIVKPGLANKEMIEQSTSFAFLEGLVITYNDEISIQHPVPDLNITGAIKAEELYAFINKIKKKDVELTVVNNEIRIEAGWAKAGLCLQEEITLPLDEIHKKGDWKPIPSNLQEAMKFAMFSCSSDMSRPVLTCVHVDKNCVESSDNYRITHFKLKEKLPINPFLIPASSVVQICKHVFTEIRSGEGWVHFRSEEGTVISCRTFFEDTYPETSGLLKVTGQQIKFPQSLPEILERARIFAKQDYLLDEIITITINKNKIWVKVKKETSWFEEHANMKYSGTAIRFSANPVLLKDILEQIRICIISKNQQSLKFEGKDWEHVICLYE